MAGHAVCLQNVDLCSSQMSEFPDFLEQGLCANVITAAEPAYATNRGKSLAGRTTAERERLNTTIIMTITDSHAAARHYSPEFFQLS